MYVLGRTCGFHFCSIVDSLSHNSYPADGNATVLRVGANVTRGVENLLAAAAGLRWTDLALLSDTTCSWPSLPSTIVEAFQLFSSVYNVSCVGLVYLVLPN